MDQLCTPAGGGLRAQELHKCHHCYDVPRGEHFSRVRTASLVLCYLPSGWCRTVASIWQSTYTHARRDIIYINFSTFDQKFLHFSISPPSPLSPLFFHHKFLHFYSRAFSVPKSHFGTEQATLRTFIVFFDERPRGSSSTAPAHYVQLISLLSPLSPLSPLLPLTHVTRVTWFCRQVGVLPHASRWFPPRRS